MMNKRAMILLLSACCLSSAGANVQVFRLEVPDGELPRIVGVDGVRREVVLVSPEEYCTMTNDLIREWKKLHETEAGRVKIHGRRVNTAITNKTVRVDTYEDGFKMPFTMSPRHLEFRAKLNAAKRSKPKSVTVEHDAATGKDIVK